MAVTKAQKADILEGLKKQFQGAKGIVFAQYRGIPVATIQDIRKGLRQSNVGYKVAKKTLFRIAAKDAGYELPDTIMDGPIAAAFGYDDEIVAARKMHEFAKKIEALKIMGGVMEGKTIDASMVKRLSSIPSREVLLAKFMGSALSPVTGFVGTLHGVVSAFARVVKAYADQQASSAPAPVEKAAEPVAAAEETPAPVAEVPAEAPSAVPAVA
ncbi:MAG: 50S ribosomal protein L10 [Candidatus Gracilibacteria bacterium]